MTRPRIVLTDGDYYAPDFEVRHFSSLGRVERTSSHGGQELAAVLVGAQVAIVRRAQFSSEVLRAARSLKGIVKWGMGFDNIAVGAATVEGIVVANTPVIAPAIAESAFTLMLAVAKRLREMTEAARTGSELRSDVRGCELWRKTLGIIGFGRIGRLVAQMARGFEMRVLFYDPYAHGVGDGEVSDLDTLLRQSDFVSIHCNLTSETHHLIGAAELEKVRPSAIMVNTARGPVLDEAALLSALQEGRLAGAGLDVVEIDPVQPGNPLLQLPNVVVTPHTLGRTQESMSRVVKAIEEAVLCLLDGRPPEYVVNPEVLSHESCRLRQLAGAS
ncbi:MAG: hypothetical protein L0387_07595 [Acidobacteria bacterium]|nr:hypothetical protein [Acidobacteriota bacterium]MCI0723912.1 hypothetical protein [Acidobacteriota bacterium]